ncbi:unnamed protein product, partial [Mesorhabditis belari]|uniref:Bardet-Biedl syndrome 1 n=1 Tax=Mesorhabditis belari TaxID=2138241 RepID=A0AAF3J8Z6_9BILA
MTNKWVNALHDDAAQVNTLYPCVGLGDLSGDGDVKLVVADMGTSRFNMKLKVFKGVSLAAESALAELPTALVTFINEQNTIPSVAVASGPSLLIYKNLKPFYKFTVPSTKINEVEEEAWSKAGSQELSTEQLTTVLSNLKEEISLKELTPISQTYLLSDDEDRPGLIQRFAARSLQNSSPITCLSTIKKNSVDVSPLDVLLIGTEKGQIYALDSQAFVVISTCQLPGTPVFICPHGVYDVEYKLFVTTREGQIFAIKRDVIKCEKPIITTKADIVGITKFGKMLAVACADKTLTFYSFKGKRQNQIKLHTPIRGIDSFFYAPKQYSGVLVALDHQVRIYNDMYQLDQLRVEPEIRWIRYGAFGREEGGLIIGSKEGGLIVKLFRRLAKLDEKIEINAQISAHNIKLNIPKKTKVFVDQTMRERENSAQMHQAYQRDLFMLKHLTTQTFFDLSKSSLSSVSIGTKEAVDITVEVHGFGPVFRLTVKLNCSSKAPLQDAWLSFVYDPVMYRFETSLIPVSYVVPGKFYTFFTDVECLHPEKGTSSEVRALLCRANRSTPIVTTIISMPISEMSLLD